MKRADRVLLGELGRLNQTVGRFVVKWLDGLDHASHEDVRELGMWLVRVGSALQERVRLADTVDGTVIEQHRQLPPGGQVGEGSDDD